MALRIPSVCADAKASAASGYTVTPPATRQLTEQVFVVVGGVTLTGVEVVVVGPGTVGGGGVLVVVVVGGAVVVVGGTVVVGACCAIAAME